MGGWRDGWPEVKTKGFIKPLALGWIGGRRVRVEGWVGLRNGRVVGGV
jgi:hypothetical protein